ncbi:MAG: hypothetical protein ACFFEF_00500 [Candidatus Thorarchaeota archaeon]
MKEDLDSTAAKLRNPLLKKGLGLVLLHTLLDSLQSSKIRPSDVFSWDSESRVKGGHLKGSSKQSITNAARRLEDAKVISRDEGQYKVNYGYIISLLLHEIDQLNSRIEDLEDKIEDLKEASTS